ncbi:CRIB domain-containing protein RIC4-like [Nicotiana tabacum]|uniref:CRIB domain-containing protein RIC4-like n=2 Tax=Nicotiana TaxID=4085 RepID=A0A1S4AIQ8_TOBAC|nr:PREDICTED: CRIB domain-containing protein RIC4-like [Nicotiana sylvestris]XP_016476582.1 PREDICTED: CRIB domain-containing protein RIC4-like [Nicotiana tabacum]
MRDRMEKFVLLPFSMGCISESSVAIGQLHHKRSSPHETNLTPTRSQEEGKEEEEEQEEGEDDDRISSLKSPNLSLMALPKFQRLFKNFKNLSHLFVDKDEMEDEEIIGMEIGVPTDVKHVTHIGIDGASTSVLPRSWEHLKIPNFLTLSS